jgi:hypothetical protein
MHWQLNHTMHACVAVPRYRQLQFDIFAQDRWFEAVCYHLFAYDIGQDRFYVSAGVAHADPSGYSCCPQVDSVWSTMRGLVGSLQASL